MLADGGHKSPPNWVTGIFLKIDSRHLLLTLVDWVKRVFFFLDVMDMLWLLEERFGSLVIVLFDEWIIRGLQTWGMRWDEQAVNILG